MKRLRGEKVGGTQRARRIAIERWVLADVTLSSQWTDEGVLMARADKPIAPERVSCKVCRKEVPKSESVVPEASDYLIYFCGLDCYDKWKQMHEAPSEHVPT